ncbi:uncharacterized protein B0P05DRAFT_531163 [Gilbertella persicaria]|uniref:uncharacterized protein n=1 Tax=Gilbertella persicaria TaxID=101096 RepID=UPI00222026F4|nr:uncharacterized protein B0P05DRAFT_531163 [Gilbertella persicaria]KAI8088024.1 hypothetical protein B0P05DRAFT_531163 [Gilbertella persicaria]
MSIKNLEIVKKKEHRLSRRLTIDTLEPYVNIRPIIKKADNEAASILVEAYADSLLLNWITGSMKDPKKKHDTYQDMFKMLIRAAASKSREFAVQINGCKGILLWSEGNSDILAINNAISKRKLWSSLGGIATMKAILAHHRNLTKMKKKIVGDRNHLSINFIGVLPAERRRHFGTSLLQYVLKKADEVQLPVFAEVWSQDILGWFKKYGFEVHVQKDLNDKENICIFYLLREPRQNIETQVTNDPIAALNLEPPREDTITA